MRRILKQTINAFNLKTSVWSIALAPDPGVLRLLQQRWQLRVTTLSPKLSAPWWTATRFGNFCLCQNTQRERKKQHAKEKEKKSKRKLIFLAEPHRILSWIQRISIPVIHKYIKQMITIGTASKLETIFKVQKACGANRNDDPRAREKGDTKIRNWKKNCKSLPSFTPDYCFTAEDSTQISEFPAQDFKHTTIFPLRETTTAPNKAL